MDSRKPIIGITMDYQKTQGGDVSIVSAGYANAIFGAGGIPVMLSPLSEDDDIRSVLEKLDGVVLVGGADLDPRNDYYQVDPSMTLMHPTRELFDRALLQLIHELRKPVLGIGAGMQLMNVMLGGTLYFHLPIDRPKALRHLDPIDRFHRHGLLVEPDTAMYQVYGGDRVEARVHSRHHMAIDDVASTFNVTARCHDGIVEAIESNAPDWFAIGTQFHPESEAASALDRLVFEVFVDGVALRMDHDPLPMKLVA